MSIILVIKRHGGTKKGDTRSGSSVMLSTTLGVFGELTSFLVTKSFSSSPSKRGPTLIESHKDHTNKRARERVTKYDGTQTLPLRAGRARVVERAGLFRTASPKHLPLPVGSSCLAKQTIVKPAEPRRSASEATTKGPNRIAHKQKASGESITPLGNEPSPPSLTTVLLPQPETCIPFGPPRTFSGIRLRAVKAKRRRQADGPLPRPAASCSKLLPAVRQLPVAVRVLFSNKGKQQLAHH
ncbi:hypothetical protein MRX96_016916 [Rhipicephalus microplus]